jgi:hypothetical protein
LAKKGKGKSKDGVLGEAIESVEKKRILDLNPGTRENISSYLLDEDPSGI